MSGIRVFQLADGWEILVGKTAQDNDRLSIRIAKPFDFWFHVSGMQGSHVVARHPDRPSQIGREAKLIAAGLAAYFSKAKNAGKVAVHMATGADVSKPRGYPPGKVILKKFTVVQTRPLAPEDIKGAPDG
ncbi:MAG: DUF814 domain-containing protein [Acidobacteria bacterium]|nr:DUF814 domain-containing protein [Acidobacteriota bacterium]